MEPVATAQPRGSHDIVAPRETGYGLTHLLSTLHLLAMSSMTAYSSGGREREAARFLQGWPGPPVAPESFRRSSRPTGTTQFAGTAPCACPCEAAPHRAGPLVPPRCFLWCLMLEWRGGRAACPIPRWQRDDVRPANPSGGVPPIPPLQSCLRRNSARHRVGIDGMCSLAAAISTCRRSCPKHSCCAASSRATPAG